MGDCKHGKGRGHGSGEEGYKKIYGEQPAGLLNEAKKRLGWTTP